MDPARSRDTGGTGVGLAITKHCVEECGGTISVWSHEGSGSTFTIELPLACGADHDASASSQVAADTSVRAVGKPPSQERTDRQAVETGQMEQQGAGQQHDTHSDR